MEVAQYSYPESYRYTKEHRWIDIQGSIATIGITDHAQRELGDIVYVDLPKVGTHVETGHTLGSVESIKAVSDIHAPISGEVTEINEALAESPQQLNEDPHGNAWLVRLRVEKGTEAKDLLSAADYLRYAGIEN